jgi:hypothetical protein
VDRKIRDRIGCNSEKQLNNSPTITGLEVESKKHLSFKMGLAMARRELKIISLVPFLLSPFGFFRILARTRRIGLI